MLFLVTALLQRALRGCQKPRIHDNLSRIRVKKARILGFYHEFEFLKKGEKKRRERTELGNNPCYKKLFWQIC